MPTVKPRPVRLPSIRRPVILSCHSPSSVVVGSVSPITTKGISSPVTAVTLFLSSYVTSFTVRSGMHLSPSSSSSAERWPPLIDAQRHPKRGLSRRTPFHERVCVCAQWNPLFDSVAAATVCSCDSPRWPCWVPPNPSELNCSSSNKQCCQFAGLALIVL